MTVTKKLTNPVKDTSPLCLISANKPDSPEQSPQFQINPEAIEFLRNIQGPICIVGVSGQFRIGKSSFCNRVILENDQVPSSGFVTSSKSESCTIGLWISRQTRTHHCPDGEEMTIIALDSEGLGSSNAYNKAYDLGIFSLTFLLCDVLCPNSKQTIAESDIEQLSLVLELSKKIRATSANNSLIINDNENESNTLIDDNVIALSKFSPKLLWVIRDDTLTLEDRNGNPQTHAQHLEDRWADQEGVSPAKNKIRRVLRAMCPIRDCAGIPLPCADKAGLAQVNSTPMKDLSIDYQKGIKDCRAKLKKFCNEPKKMAGRVVTGTSLIPIIEGLVQAVNSDQSLTTMEDISTLFLKEQARVQLDRVVNLYNEDWQKIYDEMFPHKVIQKLSRRKNPTNQTTRTIELAQKSLDEALFIIVPEQLVARLDELRNNHLNRLKRDVGTVESGAITKETLDNIVNKMKEKQDELVEVNLNNLQTWMCELLQDFEGWRIEHHGQYDLNVLNSRYNDMFCKLIDKVGKSNEVMELWYVQLKVGSKIWLWCEKASASCLVVLQEELNRVKNDKSELEVLQNKFDVLSEQYREKIEQLVLAETESTKLLDELNKVRNSLLESMTIYADNDAVKERQVQLLEAELKSSKEQVDELKEECQRMQFEQLQLQDQVKSIEIWKSQLEELTERNHNLETQAEQIRQQSTRLENDYAEQIEIATRESLDLINKAQEKYQQDAEIMQSRWEEQQQSIEKLKQQKQDKERELEHLDTVHQKQLERLQQDIQRSEQSCQVLKQEQIVQQRGFDDRQTEWSRNMTAMSNSWKEEMQQIHNRDSEKDKQHHEMVLKITSALHKAETDAKVSIAKYDEVIEDVRATKKMRFENQALTTELAKTNTELTVLRHDKVEREKTIKAVQAEYVQLEKKLATQEGQHRLDLYRAKVVGATSSSPLFGVKNTMIESKQ